MDWIKANLWAIYAFAALWVLFWALASVVVRRSRGHPILARVPKDALFVERWTSGRSAANGLVAREEAIETFDTVRQQVDPYTTVRRFYVRSRAAAIGSSEPEPRTIEDVPDFELDF